MFYFKKKKKKTDTNFEVVVIGIKDIEVFFRVEGWRIINIGFEVGERWRRAGPHETATEKETMERRPNGESWKHEFQADELTSDEGVIRRRFRWSTKYETVSRRSWNCSFDAKKGIFTRKASVSYAEGLKTNLPER